MIQVSGVGRSQTLSPTDRDDAIAMASDAMERAIHFLVSGYDLDAI